VSGDPYWSSVVFLAKCNGANNSTTLVDEKGHTTAAVGNAKISTAQSKFGGAAAYFDGSGDRFYATDSADFAFGTADFTIEFFAYLINGGHGGNWARLLENYFYPNDGGWGFVCTGSDNPAYIRFDTSAGAPLITSLAPVPNNTWTHVAVSRASGVIRLFINGVVQGSYSTVRDFTRQRLSIGANSNGAGEAFNGYLDEIRLTKGVARYTADFTVPVAEFPTFATDAALIVPGLEATEFGATSVRNAYAELFPASWDSAQLPAGANVYNFNKQITAYPFTGQPEAPPSPVVYNLLQQVYSGYVATAFVAGTAWVSNYYRAMYPNGAAHAVFGTQSVYLGRRYVGPAYLPGTQTSFGTPFVAWDNRDVLPVWGDTSTFGTALVRDRAQRAYPAGRPSALAFGIPLVRDRAQRAYPFALLSSEYGTGFLYLRNRELFPSGILQWEFERDRFSNYNYVFNKNKRIGTNGYVDSRFPTTHYVYNNARALYARGENHFRAGVAFVAYRVRSFGVEWYTQEVFGTPYVRNYRTIISLDGWGWHSMKFGIPSKVWSNQQTTKPYSTYDHSGYGRPWVDYGLRGLYPSSILTQPAGTPYVAYRVRHIRPAGIQHGYMGTAALEEHHNIIKLWGFTKEGYGTPSVRNLTPMIYAYSNVAFLPGGKPKVQLMRRYITYPNVFVGDGVGTPYVSYRTRKIRPPAPDYLRWGNATVQFDQSQLVPPQQRILQDGSIQAGAGVVSYLDWEFPDTPYSGATIPFGSVRVRLNAIYPEWGGTLIKFGTPYVRDMTIFVNPGPADFAIGQASVLGGTKWLHPGGFLDTDVGGPQVVGTQIIRCGEKRDVLTSTWYAHEFHNYGSPVDAAYVWRAQTVGGTFGARTSCTLKHRRVYQYSATTYPPMWFYTGWRTTEGAFIAAEYGAPHVTHRPQHIRPTGLRAYARGLGIVENVGTKIIYPYGWEDPYFGPQEVQLQDYGPKTVTVPGLPPKGFGGHEVQLFNREVHPYGIYQFTSPRGAQYVGPYLRVYASPALDHSSFGTLYIDYRHRRVVQADVTDDRPPWSTSRAVRVYHEARGYFVEGSSFAVQFGGANVGHSLRQTEPDGWEEFETGFSYVPDSYPGLSRLRAQAFITHPNTSTMEFGNATVST